MSLRQMLCQPSVTDSEGAEKVAEEAIPDIKEMLEKMEHLRGFERIPDTLIRKTIEVVMEEDQKTVDVSTFINKNVRYVMQELGMEKKSEEYLKEVIDIKLVKMRVEPKTICEIKKAKIKTEKASDETSRWIFSVGCVDDAFGYQRIVSNVVGFYEVILEVLNEVSYASAADDDDVQYIGQIAQEHKRL